MGGRLRFVVLVVLAALGAGSERGVAAPVRDLAGGAKLGAQIDPVTVPAFCAKLREDRSRAVVVFLTRGVIERNDGTLNEAAIDNRVEPDRACGLDVAVRVRPTTQPDQDSFLPQGEELNSYLSLLTQLSAYLRGRVGRYAIDNEAAAVSHFDGSAADYFTLLRVSAAALRSGDPDAEILDGTMASGSMTAVMVADLYAQGRYPEAIALAQETQANELGGGPPVTDQASLTAYVQDSRVQRSIQFFEGAVANQDAYDAFQLHYYGPWRSLPNMFDFVRAHGIRVPVEVWEVAHRYRDGRPFEEAEHADETARLLLTAAGEGSAWTVFSSLLGSEENGAIGLLSFDGSADRPARASYRSVAEAVTGATAAERLQLPAGAWGYRFERPAGTLLAAWADPKGAHAGRALGLDATTAAVRRAGEESVEHVKLAGLTLDGTPVLVEPDLLEISQRGARARHHRLRLELTCPATSPRPSCRGELVVEGGGKHPPRLASARYRVRRGARVRQRVRLRGRRPVRAVAHAKSCPPGLKGSCRSWAQVR